MLMQVTTFYKLVLQYFISLSFHFFGEFFSDMHKFLPFITAVIGLHNKIKILNGTFQLLVK